MTLNLKNYKLFEKVLYCNTHTPTVKGTVIVETVTMKSAMNAPKKSGGALGIHKADPRVAPSTSGDFTVNQAQDQSTENNPDTSGIVYEQGEQDQSRENNPDMSGIAYEEGEQDQSRE